MIFSECPVVKYPQWKTFPICLGCYNLIDLDNCTLCKICNWPMCSEICCKNEDHLLECGIFQNQGIKMDCNLLKSDKETQNRHGVHFLYDIISPLRMLALRGKRKQESWKRLTSLMSHKDEWAKDPTWKDEHKHAIGMLHLLGR